MEVGAGAFGSLMVYAMAPAAYGVRFVRIRIREWARFVGGAGLMVAGLVIEGGAVNGREWGAGDRIRGLRSRVHSFFIAGLEAKPSRMEESIH